MMNEAEIVDSLRHRNIERKLRMLEQLLVATRNNGGRLPCATVTSRRHVMRALSAVLADRDWSVRYKCVQLVNELVRRYDDADYEPDVTMGDDDDEDEEGVPGDNGGMVALLPRLAAVMGDRKVTVRRLAVQTFHTYMRQVDDVTHAIRILARHGAEHPDLSVAREVIVSLPMLLTPEFAAADFSELVQSLCRRLVDTADDAAAAGGSAGATRDCALKALSMIHELVGESAFSDSVRRLPAPLRNLYAQFSGQPASPPLSHALTQSTAMSNGNHVSQSAARTAPRTQPQHREPAVVSETVNESPVRNHTSPPLLEFGFVPRHVIDKLDEQRNFRTRALAAEELRSAVFSLRTRDQLDRVQPHLPALVSLLGRLFADTNFKLCTLAADAIDALLARCQQRCVSCLPALVSAVERRMGESKSVLRQRAVRHLVALMRHAGGRAVLPELAPLTRHRNSRVRQETLSAITGALLTLPSYAFDLAAVCELVAPALLDPRRQVRHVCMECCAVLAQTLGAGRLVPLVRAVNNVEMADGGEGAMLALQARLARRQLPKYSAADGLLEPATPLPNSANARRSDGALDVAWILAASAVAGGAAGVPGITSAQSDAAASRSGETMELESVSSVCSTPVDTQRAVAASGSGGSNSTPSSAMLSHAPKRYMSAGRRNRLPWDEDMPSPQPQTREASDDRLPKRSSAGNPAHSQFRSRATWGAEELNNALNQDSSEQTAFIPRRRTFGASGLPSQNNADTNNHIAPIPTRPSLVRSVSSRSSGKPKVPPISTSRAGSVMTADDLVSEPDTGRDSIFDDDEDPNEEMFDSLRQIRNSATKKKAEKIFERLDRAGQNGAGGVRRVTDSKIAPPPSLPGAATRDSPSPDSMMYTAESGFHSMSSTMRRNEPPTEFPHNDVTPYSPIANDAPQTVDFKPHGGVTFRENRSSDVVVVGRGYQDETGVNSAATSGSGNVKPVRKKFNRTQHSPLGMANTNNPGEQKITDDKVPDAVIGKTAQIYQHSSSSDLSFSHSAETNINPCTIVDTPVRTPNSLSRNITCPLSARKKLCFFNKDVTMSEHTASHLTSVSQHSPVEFSDSSSSSQQVSGVKSSCSTDHSSSLYSTEHTQSASSALDRFSDCRATYVIYNSKNRSLPIQPCVPDYNWPKSTPQSTETKRDENIDTECANSTEQSLNKPLNKTHKEECSESNLSPLDPLVLAHSLKQLVDGDEVDKCSDSNSPKVHDNTNTESKSLNQSDEKVSSSEHLILPDIYSKPIIACSSKTSPSYVKDRKNRVKKVSTDCESTSGLQKNAKIVSPITPDKNSKCLIAASPKPPSIPKPEISNGNPQRKPPKSRQLSTSSPASVKNCVSPQLGVFDSGSSSHHNEFTNQSMSGSNPEPRIRRQSLRVESESTKAPMPKGIIGVGVRQNKENFEESDPDDDVMSMARTTRHQLAIKVAQRTAEVERLQQQKQQQKAVSPSESEQSRLAARKAEEARRWREEEEAERAIQAREAEERRLARQDEPEVSVPAIRKPAARQRSKPPTVKQKPSLPLDSSPPTVGSELRVGKSSSNTELEEWSALQLFSEPEKALVEAFKSVSVDDWSSKCAGLNGLRRMVKHHPDILLRADLHNLYTVLTTEVKNLRSQVSRLAITAFGELFQCSAQKPVDQDLELAIKQLLLRSGETNNFIREEAEVALYSMADNIPAQKAMVMLIANGASSRNVIIRSLTSQLLVPLIVRLGPGRLLSGVKDTAERILPTAVSFALDASAECRYNGQKILYELMQHEAFDRMLAKHVSANNVRHVATKLDNLRKNGLGPPPSESSSARSRRGDSSRGVSANSDQPSPSLRRRANGSSNQSANSRLDSSSAETIAEMAKKLSSADWNERVEAITLLRDTVIINPDLIANNITKSLDNFIPCLNDSNSKVTVLALETALEIVPPLGNSLSNVIIQFHEAIYHSLISKNSRIASLSRAILQSCIECIDLGIIISPYCNYARNGVPKARFIYVDFLKVFVDQLYSRRSKIIATQVLPVIWDLMSTICGKGPGTPTPDLRQSTQKLIDSLYSQMGDSLLEASRTVTSMKPPMVEQLSEFISKSSSYS